MKTMETKSIEERAHNFAITNASNIQEWDGDYEIMVMSYEEGAQDQDRISRQEERERCIKAAGAIVCKVHSCGTRVNCTPETCDRASNCGWLLELRKAMKEGGEA